MTGKRGALIVILNGLKEGEKKFCWPMEKGSSSLTVADDRRVALLGDPDPLMPPVVRGRFFTGKTGLLEVDVDDAQEVVSEGCPEKSSPLCNSLAASSARAERGQNIVLVL